MKFQPALATFCLLACTNTPMADRGVFSEMRRLGVRSALVISSQAVDEYPVWSLEGDALAANIEGRWMKVELESLVLEPGTWHEQAIGVAKRSALTPIEASAVAKWDKAGDHGARKVAMKNGTTVELKQTELSTELVVTPRGGPANVLWRSGLENCHSLAVSPDGRFVAYICELNGVIVTEP